MKIAAVIERDDGGADVMLEEISKWELHAILQAGFVALVEERAKAEAEKQATPAIFRGDNNKGEVK